MVLQHSLAATAVAMTLGSSLAVANAAGGMHIDDRWNPQHIDGLPVEIRAAIAPFARVCGEPLAAGHAFARYLQKGSVKLVGLHFEHLRCDDRMRICKASGCLHQVYISYGGAYRLFRSSYVRELDLTELRVGSGQ
jgi:hypothetical protein